MSHPVPANGGLDYPTKVAAAVAALDRRLKGNLLDNGAFQVWQRTALTWASGARQYTADRWEFYRSGSAAGATATQQAGTTARYAMRLQRNNGNALTSDVILTQTIETVNSIPAAGKSVTVNLRAKCGANYSASGSSFTVRINTGTGTDENVNAGFTGNVQLLNQSFVASTTQAEFTATATIAASAKQIAITIFWSPTGTAGVNDWLEVEEVQLVIGDYAGDFPYRTETEEFDICRRHLPAIFASNTSTPIGVGQCYLTTAALVVVQFSTPARAAVTGVVVSGAGHATLLQANSTTVAGTGIAFNRGGKHACELNITGASGLVVGNATVGLLNNATGYILFTGAEL